MCEGGLKRLREVFPPTYSAFPGYQTPEKLLPGFRTEDAIAIVNLARLTAATDLLAALLYVCTQLSVDTILSRSCLVPESNNEGYLSMDDVARCLSGQTELRVRQHRVVLKVVSSGSRAERCTKPHTCDAGLARMRHQVVDALAAPSSLTEHRDTLRLDDLWNFIGSFDLCEHCHSDIRSQALHHMRLTFDDLPAILNLEPYASQH